MKKNLITLIIISFMLMHTRLYAQDKDDASIYFGAIFGTKLNNFSRHFISDVKPELYSFSVGAGSAFTKNNYVVGFEFLYSSANRNNTNGDIQYVGFNNALTLGYNISKKQAWKVEPTIGVVLNNNQLIVQNNTANSFQNLTNNQLAANLGLNFKIINNRGLFTGIKVGYVLPFSGESEWENTVSGESSGLEDNLNSFYLQLNIGGLLNLTKND